MKYSKPQITALGNAKTLIEYNGTEKLHQNAFDSSVIPDDQQGPAYDLDE